jgi:hypothetical protein
MRDHMMGYPPATSPDFNGLACEYNRWWGEPMPADACGQSTQDRAPRRYVDPTCMTKGDHEGHDRDVQMGRLNLPRFHVEQPGTLVYCGSVDGVFNDAEGIKAFLTETAEEQKAYIRGQEAAAAHARSMGEAHQKRMLKRQMEIKACVGMQQGDSGWRDWNDG